MEEMLAEVVHEAFDQFVDIDGNLALDRFRLVMRELGDVWSSSEVEQLFATIDVDSSGDIDEEEFRAALNLPEMKDVRERVLLYNSRATQKAFDKFAEGGEISLSRLSDVLQTLGLVLSPVQVQKMFDMADEDGSGGIDFEEFKVAFKSKEWLEVNQKVSNQARRQLGGIKSLIQGLRRENEALAKELARVQSLKSPKDQGELVESLHRKIAELEEKLANQRQSPLYMRRIQELEMQLATLRAEKELDATQMQADKLEMESLLVLYYDLISQTHAHCTENYPQYNAH